MREQFTAEDLREQLRELLAVKYRRPRTREVLTHLLEKCSEFVLELRIFPEPVVVHLRRDDFTVSDQLPERVDMRVTIPFEILMKVMGGGLPLADLLRGRIRFWGNPFAAKWLQRLFYVPVGDPRAAASYFYHYFVDDLE